MADASYRLAAVDEGNARHVATVFRSVYGEDFPFRDVYEPALLWQRIRAGEVVSALAFAADGEPAGYISLFKTAPNPRLWETGSIVVVPRYAQTGIALQLFGDYETLLSSKGAELDGYFTEAVCSHYFTQISGAESGVVDCGLALDQLDGGSFKDGKSNKAGSARVSCLLGVKEKTGPSGPAHIPARYEGMLRRIAAGLRPRAWRPSAAGLPGQGASAREERYYPAARTWKLSFREIGGHWTSEVEEIVAEARRRNVISLQITLNMALPCIGEAVERLRGQGFFFGGMAPLWFGTDGLLMQQVSGSETDYEGMKLYTPMARELLAYVRADRETVCETGGDRPAAPHRRE